jgi:hypothetical protein
VILFFVLSQILPKKIKKIKIVKQKIVANWNAQKHVGQTKMLYILHSWG